MIYALVYACKYDLQITATDTVVLLLFYSGFEGKGCGWMDGGINSLMKLFIYLFILCMSVVHYVAMPLPFLLVIKCCQSTGMSARRYSAGKGRCVSSDCEDWDEKRWILTKNQCRFFSNDPSTPPLLLLLFGWKNKLMYLIMRATIAVIIFLLSSNQLPLVCHSKKLLIINNIGECFLSVTSATSSYLCCPFVARFEECHVILRHIISARVLIWDTNQQRSGVMA